jgi:hypothetical protein
MSGNLLRRSTWCNQFTFEVSLFKALFCCKYRRRVGLKQTQGPVLSLYSFFCIFGWFSFIGYFFQHGLTLGYKRNILSSPRSEYYNITRCDTLLWWEPLSFSFHYVMFYTLLALWSDTKLVGLAVIVRRTTKVSVENRAQVVCFTSFVVLP